jgi:hypothetical protein
VPRIAALVVAVALIVGALIVRSHRDTAARRGPYRLTCATEMADVCRALGGARTTVTIEPAGVTSDRLIGLAEGADPGFDGWLAAGPWVRIVSSARANAGRSIVTHPRDARTLAHTRIAIIGWRDRLDALRQSCGGPLTWRCLGDAAARSTWKANHGKDAWGLLKLALPDPPTESAGLIGLTGATIDFGPLPSLAPADLAQVDKYQKMLDAIRRAAPSPVPSISTMLSTGPAVVDVLVGFEADIAPLLQASARRNDLEVVYLSPVLDVPAVLISLRSGEPSNLSTALVDSGWTKTETAKSMPLPPGEILGGLRQAWKDATG